MILSTFFSVNSIKLVPISIYGIIYNLKPVLVIVIDYFAGQETFTRKKFFLIFLSFLGAGLIINPNFFLNFFSQDNDTQKFNESSMDKSTKVILQTFTTTLVVSLL